MNNKIKNMTDNDFMKALEIHISKNKYCEDCPIYQNKYIDLLGDDCFAELLEKSFELITRLYKDIDTLKAEKSKLATLALETIEQSKTQLAKEIFEPFYNKNYLSKNDAEQIIKALAKYL